MAWDKRCYYIIQSMLFKAYIVKVGFKTLVNMVVNGDKRFGTRKNYKPSVIKKINFHTSDKIWYELKKRITYT